MVEKAEPQGTTLGLIPGAKEFKFRITLCDPHLPLGMEGLRVRNTSCDPRFDSRCMTEGECQLKVRISFLSSETSKEKQYYTTFLNPRYTIS